MSLMEQKNIDSLSNYENEIVTKKGEFKIISWFNVLTRDFGGFVIDVTCLGVDLTERQHNELVLREREHKYRSLFEESNDGVLLYTPEGIIVEGNSRAAEMLGYTKGELVGLSLQGLHPAKDRGLCRKFVELAQNTGLSSFETVMIKKDGITEINAEISASIVDQNSGLIQG